MTIRRSWALAAVGLVGIGLLAAVQSVGYWVVSAVRGEPASVLFVDHAGPAVTSGLVAIVALALGAFALRRARSGQDSGS